MSIGFEKFFRFFALFFDNVSDYVVFDFLRSLVGYGDEDGRAAGDCAVEITPHVAVVGDDVAAAAIDGGISSALVTLLLDGRAGDYSQQDDER